MKIAFHAPLKSPDHPVPSGDRLMARQLFAALQMAGHAVELVSGFRAFSPTPDVPPEQEGLATAERQRIAALWREQGVPDLWFCYHPYYKAPDLLGPDLCRQFSLPYVTAECSYSGRRNIGGWALSQDKVLAGIRQAAVNICLTVRDRTGLLQAEPQARVEHLPPFIDASAFLMRPPAPRPGHLVTVAMMRPGDKLSSYRALAAALAKVCDLDWRLSILGDGPARTEVEAAFSALPPDRVRWLGQGGTQEVADLLSSGALYLWPGHGEAYGLAYLEAQAAGLPVVAEKVAGVPEVVEHGTTGVLTPPGDVEAYADAVARLLSNPAERDRLAAGARRFVAETRSIDAAAKRLDTILRHTLETAS
ncbi:glycosyltransferase family 4 protein [Rhizobium sp. CSW-27]|uniref:glycosyltransferase family 4 protein n=1 Tax=Rhizobium sp. CSW-27 TaxID=2839985 RepID=UPI001C013CC6|nr:glycosyltransferase family 4 protein [Rhizobium sp. CSW-27]MBT9371800.1 glycosyltransferase family 4 protein [Rhizobium sp. CSW-27]